MTTRVAADFEIDGKVMGIVYRVDFADLAHLRTKDDPWGFVTARMARELIKARRT